MTFVVSSKDLNHNHYYIEVLFTQKAKGPCAERPWGEDRLKPTLKHAVESVLELVGPEAVLSQNWPHCTTRAAENTN